MSFTSYLTGLLVGPLAGPWGTRYVQSLGAALDGPEEAILDASLLRGPADAMDDALTHHGAARMLPRLTGETLAAWRARLVAAWELWTWAGTRTGLLTALAQLGFTGLTLRTTQGWLPDLPPDRRTDLWARWWAFVAGHPWTLDVWDTPPGTWDDGGTWDTDATLEDVARVRTHLRQWSNARDRGYVVLHFGGDGDVWGPDTPFDHGTWGAATDTTVIWTVE